LSFQDCPPPAPERLGGLARSVTATSDTTPTPTPPIATPGCTGDCTSDGEVPANELFVRVNITLGNAEASACAQGVAQFGPAGKVGNVDR